MWSLFVNNQQYQFNKRHVYMQGFLATWMNSFQLAKSVISAFSPSFPCAVPWELSSHLNKQIGV